MALTYNQIVVTGVVNDLATIYVSGNEWRHFKKDVSGFALIAYYELTNGPYTGPMVVSPTRTVAHYTNEAGTSAATTSNYITVNGTKWYYTPSAQFLYGYLAPASATAKYLGRFATHVAAVTELVNTYYSYLSKIGYSVSPTGSGTVTLNASYEPIGNNYTKKTNTFTATATPNTTHKFSKWTWSTGSSTSTNNPETFAATNNVTVTANFVRKYNVTLNYDSNLGSASLSWNDDVVTLTATPKQYVSFDGWYKGSTRLSTNATYSYTPTANDTVTARFSYIYQVSAYTSGNGSIQVTRESNTTVVISVIPDSNWRFVKYIVEGLDEYFELVSNNNDFIVTNNGSIIEILTGGVKEETTTPLRLTLDRNITITAYFEEKERYTVSVSTNIPLATVYISGNQVHEGENLTLWARPFPDYQFVKWEDGNTENPRIITVTQDVTMVAIYQKSPDSSGIYQYRCFIKDQLYLTQPPKAFLTVDTFTTKTDKMTRATSQFNIIGAIPSNVNDGDILVLYDARGQFLYRGVIDSISDNTIRTAQMESFYKGKWIYNVHPSATLEQEIAWLLGQYAQGKMYGSTWTDTLVAQRLGGITIDYIGTTSANLPTDLDKDGNEEYTVKDMETFIYELYENYNIIFEFEINFTGTNYVHIKVPSYERIKVGNNMYAIQDMSPVTEIEETNRLIIYSKDKTYRSTYIATKNSIVKQPTTNANRFNITNTKIVFSDDDEADLVASNLPTTMYNHHLSFTLIIKNFIYEFGDFNLGGELDIYNGDDYYDSVLTGYEITKQSNQNITSVKMVCGKVRQKLTQLLTLNKI